MMDHENALKVAYRIQEYEIVRILGAGGFGITYLAYDHNLDKPVAIKEYLPDELAVRKQGNSVVPKSSTVREDFQWGLESFMREARTLARFKHTNLVQVHRFFEAHGTAYIVMEYVEGETLTQLLERQGTLSEAQLKALLLPILDGLEQVHLADYLHRDIKPGNIVIRAEDNSPVLIDFGAARHAVGIKSKSVTSIVTPGYAPIEQYSTKGKQGPWTDIYALGAVSYRALTGIEPDDATERIVNDELQTTVIAGKGKASEAFLTGIDVALKVKLDERPQCINQWRNALVGDMASPSTPSSAGTRSLPTSPTGKTTSKLALVVILLIVSGGVGYYLSQQDSAPRVPAASVAVASPAVKAPTPATTDTAATTDKTLASSEEANVAVDIQTLLNTAAAHLAAGKWSEAKAVYESILEKDPKETAAMSGLSQAAQALAESDAARTAAAPPEMTVETAPETSAEAESDATGSQIAELLSGARADIAARRLLSPQGSNAYEKLQTVFSLSSGNIDAVALLDDILNSYQGLLKQALSRNDIAKAQTYLGRMKQVNPDAPMVSAAEKEITVAQRRMKVRSRVQHKLAGEMIWIPGGTYQMGSNKGDDDERPVHEVRIKSFWLGNLEVTQAQWRHVIGSSLSLDFCRNCPVEQVSWDDVQTFIKRLNLITGGHYRLPTEAEWEYACRSGGRDEKYCGGNHPDEFAWHLSNSRSASKPVAQKRTNGLGLYDMSGNLWEWVEDCANNSYVGAPSDGSAWTRGDCSQRVLRGGSWNDKPEWVRSTNRSRNARAYRGNLIGFRLASD